jgi:hypothetical protein
MPDNQVVPIHPTIFHWQKAMLEAYARNEGKLGISEALREVLTDYRNMKAIEAGIPLTALPQEDPA